MDIGQERQRPSVGGGFADAFTEHHEWALRLAVVLTGDAGQAEDVVADAFVRLHRRWHVGIEQPRAYLRRVIVSVVNDRLRRLVHERAHLDRLRTLPKPVHHFEDHVADSDVLEAALRRLPRRQRTALVLRYYEDLTYADVAQAMGVTEGTAKSTVFRGLVGLRRAFAELEVTHAA